MPDPTPDPVAITNAYFISPAGNDSNPGSESRPWRTLQKAANTVPVGATVYLREGTHAGFVMRRSGTAHAPITFRNYPGERAVVRATSTQRQTIYIHDWAARVSDIQISGLVVENAQGGSGSGAGIFVHNATRVILSRNSVHHNRSFGIYLYDASGVTIEKNDITKNEVGIYVARNGEGVEIRDNDIYENDEMTLNTPPEVLMHDDYGATGIAFNKTTGRIIAANNRIWGHRALSYDYGWDGSGLEIWGASNVTMTDNILWDNENVLETGTDGTMGCYNNKFVRNVAYAATSEGRSYGVFLRCAENMIVAHNTLYGLYQFAFTVSHYFGAHGHSIENLRVFNNIVVSTAADTPAYWIRSALPASVDIDGNLLYNTAGGRIATVDGKGTTRSLATLTSWTGADDRGLQGDPEFVTPGRDFRLNSGSPAVDRGLALSDLPQSYRGSAPDIGRFEVEAP